MKTGPNYRGRLNPEQAARWVREQALALAQLAQKPVLVKETGFPHGGGQKYTPDSQQRFWKAYRTQPTFLALEHLPMSWVSYSAAFEGFDLPWKAAQHQRGMEQAWGLLSHERFPYPAFKVWLKHK